MVYVALPLQIKGVSNMIYVALTLQIKGVSDVQHM